MSESNTRQEMKDFLARHALRVALDCADEHADGSLQIGLAATSVIIVHARGIAERLLRARAEGAALETMLRGLDGLTVPNRAGAVVPFVVPEEVVDALANDAADNLSIAFATATEAWRAFHAALVGGDAEAQLEVTA